MKWNYVFVLLLLFPFMSCKKDSVTEPESYLEGTNWVPSRVKKLADYVYLDEKYSVVYVVNLPAPDLGHTATEGHQPCYFNFDSKGYVDSVLAVKGEITWHVKFSGIYNSDITADASSAEGTAGTGKIRVVRTPFNDLTEAPATAMIRNTVPISMSIEDIIDSWGYYEFSNHALIPYSDRSLIFLLKDGRYVKMQLVNLYKDNPATAPDYKDPNSKNLAPFFNFRYYIQQTAGSTKLQTK